MIVDGRRLLETKHERIIIDAMPLLDAAVIRLGTVAVIGVLDLAVDFDAVGIFFELTDADAKIIELVGKLRRETIERRAIGAALRCTSERLRHHLSHFVARDVSITEESAAVNNAAVFLIKNAPQIFF